MGQASPRNNNNPHKSLALRHDRDPPESVGRRLDLSWRNFRFGAEAEVVSLRTKSAVQSTGFASGKVQRPSRTSARGR